MPVANAYVDPNARLEQNDATDDDDGGDDDGEADGADDG
jgi:hypothetical protein